MLKIKRRRERQSHAHQRGVERQAYSRNERAAKKPRDVEKVSGVTDQQP